MRRLVRIGVQLAPGRALVVCAELVTPIGFAETILHGPALLASVPSPEPAGPVISPSVTLAAIIRTGWTITGLRAVAIAWRWRAVAGIGTEIEIDLLCRCRAGEADDRPCRHRRYQDVLHRSPPLS